MKNTKKLLALGLATTMLFNLAACGNESNSGGGRLPVFCRGFPVQ